MHTRKKGQIYWLLPQISRSKGSIQSWTAEQNCKSSTQDEHACHADIDMIQIRPLHWRISPVGCFPQIAITRLCITIIICIIMQQSNGMPAMIHCKISTYVPGDYFVPHWCKSIQGSASQSKKWTQWGVAHRSGHWAALHHTILQFLQVEVWKIVNIQGRYTVHTVQHQSHNQLMNIKLCIVWINTFGCVEETEYGWKVKIYDAHTNTSTYP